MNTVNSNSDAFGSTKAELVARVPYPKLNTSAPLPTMAAMPNAKPGPSRNLFTQPQRQAGRGPSAPSTISTASSTSSGATIRPPVTTPRALSPTSGHMQLPLVRDGFRRMSSIPGGKKGQLKQHPHWDDPAKVAQDIALLDEKSVLEGLSWRLEQYLDIQEPFGLIVPEMVEAARMDPNDVCGPALDMLMSAIFADGDPPVCEIPRVQTDASGNQYANYTVPLTCKNSPDALKNLFTSWSSVVQRLKGLDPRFHSEIARIICDMEPLENPLLPQVMLIAHDLKVIAKEISLRRSFLAKFDAAFLQMLKESDGGTLPPFRRNPTLPFLPEAPEPSSSSSSRSSSRNSHRSRHRTRSLSNSRREKANEGDLHRMPPSGLRSRSSSVHSLRLDKDGIPLTDAEIAAEGLIAATGSEHALELNQRLGPNSNAVHIRRPSSTNGDRTNEYNKIAPMVIPAFSSDNDSYPPPNLNAPSGHSQHLGRLEPPQQHHSAPVSPSGPVIATLPHLRDADMPSRPLPRPGAPSSDISMPNPLPPKVVGPRPLPRMPSPKPKAPAHPLQPPPAQNVISALPTSQQGGIALPIVVPDQSASSSLVPLIESLSIQIPSQPMAVTGFEVPSATDISNVVEVPSSSPHDLHNARLHYAMESSSSLPYMDDRYPSLTNKKRHGQVNMSAFGAGGGSGVPPRPATAEPTFTRGMQNGIQLQPRDEPWAAPRSISSASHYATGDRLPNVNGNGWTPPADWDNPPPPPPKDDDKDKEKESSGFFRGIKTLLGKGDKGGSSASAASQIQDNALLSRPQDSRAQSQIGQYARGPVSHPDNNMVYYQGVGSSQSAQFSPYDYSMSVPSSADSRAQVPIVNGHSQVPYSIPSHQHHPSGPPPPASRLPANAHGLLPSQQAYTESPGFAQVFQVNPVAARSYYGAGSSSTSSRQMYDPTHQGTSTYGAHPAARTAPVASSSLSEPPGLMAIRETMYGAIIEALSTEALRKAMAKDEQRAYFSAMSLAILNVSMTLQSSTDSPNIVHMLTGDVRLSDLPGPYKTAMTELAAIGREARKLGEEDDERAIAYVARGKELPEPRVSRVRRLLERGVGYVDADGRVRGASSGQGGTGRSREFSNKINSLAVDMMKLPAFREEMLRRVAP